MLVLVSPPAEHPAGRKLVGNLTYDNEDGSWDVLLDDGTEEANVTAERLRVEVTEGGSRRQDSFDNELDELLGTTLVAAAP